MLPARARQEFREYGWKKACNPVLLPLTYETRAAEPSVGQHPACPIRVSGKHTMFRMRTSLPTRSNAARAALSLTALPLAALPLAALLSGLLAASAEASILQQDFCAARPINRARVWISPPELAAQQVVRRATNLRRRRRANRRIAPTTRNTTPTTAKAPPPAAARPLLRHRELVLAPERCLASLARRRFSLTTSARRASLAVSAFACRCLRASISCGPRELSEAR